MYHGYWIVVHFDSSHFVQCHHCYKIYFPQTYILLGWCVC